MGAFATLPSGGYIGTYCPWCDKNAYSSSPLLPQDGENVKQHFRQHIYEDLQNHKISLLEVRRQQQRQLQKYLEGLLLDKAS